MVQVGIMEQTSLKRQSQTDWALKGATFSSNQWWSRTELCKVVKSRSQVKSAEYTQPLSRVNAGFNVNSDSTNKYVILWWISSDGTLVNSLTRTTGEAEDWISDLQNTDFSDNLIHLQQKTRVPIL